MPEMAKAKINEKWFLRCRESGLITEIDDCKDCHFSYGVFNLMVPLYRDQKLFVGKQVKCGARNFGVLVKIDAKTSDDPSIEDL